jgi:hypothetical protein
MCSETDDVGLQVMASLSGFVGRWEDSTRQSAAQEYAESVRVLASCSVDALRRVVALAGGTATPRDVRLVRLSSFVLNLVVLV